MTEKLILVVPGEGKYYWHPVIQLVTWVQPRARRPSWEHALSQVQNTQQKALLAALKHATEWAKTPSL